MEAIATRSDAIALRLEAIATVTPLKYVEGGPRLIILPEVVYNSYSVHVFGGDRRLRIL